MNTLNQDKLLKLAEQAGAFEGLNDDDMIFPAVALERFASLVLSAAQEERKSVYQWRKRSQNGAWYDTTKADAYSRVDDHYEARTLYAAPPSSAQTNSEDIRYQAWNEAMLEQWDAAYTAFKGAFDTPVARRNLTDEYCSDARRRMRDFDESIRSLKRPLQAQEPRHTDDMNDTVQRGLAAGIGVDEAAAFDVLQPSASGAVDSQPSPDKLPPLPPFDDYMTLSNGDDFGYWTRGTVKNYARTAIALAIPHAHSAVIETIRQAVMKSKLFRQFTEQSFWHAHHVDLEWRFNGKDVREEADWLKDIWYALRGKHLTALSQSAAPATEKAPSCSQHIEILWNAVSKLESQVCRNPDLPQDYRTTVHEAFAVLRAISQSAAPVSRDWSEDFSHENGNYLCECCQCGNTFKGHKRRVTCKACAAPVSEQPALPERDPSKPAEQQGIFRKFEVRRVDGSDVPGGKHYGCRYFVLDLDHDPAAPAGMRAYAVAVRATHSQLAADIEAEFGVQSAAQVNEFSAVEQLSELLRGLEAGPACGTWPPYVLHEMGRAIAEQAKRAAHPQAAQAKKEGDE